MTSTELKELVMTHFSLVEAPSVEETPEVTETVAENFDARTDAEEEGYKDGEKDAIEDIKEAIAETVKEEKLEEEGTEVVEDEAEKAKEEMMEDKEDEVAVSMEEVVKVIGDIVSEEMKKMNEKYDTLAAKLETMASEPASEKTLPKPSESKVERFNAAEAKNADRISMALKMIKNKK